MHSVEVLALSEAHWRSPLLFVLVRPLVRYSYSWGSYNGTKALAYSAHFPSHPTQNRSFQGRSSQPMSWLSTEKLKQTQQSKHASITKYSTHKMNSKKLKPGLVGSYDLRPGNGQDLFWFWRFINLSLIYLLRHWPTYLQPRDPHRAVTCKTFVHPSHSISLWVLFLYACALQRLRPFVFPHVTSWSFNAVEPLFRPIPT